MKEKVKIIIKQPDQTRSGLEIWGACKARDIQECFKKVKECFTPSPKKHSGIINAKLLNDDVVITEL